jgi:AraC-like DNA-binding protein
MDLLFDFKAVGTRLASVIGTMTRPITVTTTGAVDLLGVRFRPGGLPSFVDLDAAELTDADADLANFWTGAADEIWHRMAEATPADRLGILRKALACLANQKTQADPFIRHSVGKLEAARGGLRIDDLQKSTGLSTRQLERKFRRHVGISPKAFARVVRFKGAAAAALANPETPDWVALAGEFGFADQAHLVREFKTFSDLTPTFYM